MEEVIKRKPGRPKGTTKKETGVKKNDTPIGVTRVFTQNKEAKSLIVIHRGGARSSKSFSLCQEISDRFFSLPGRKILIIRKTLPALRLTTYKMMKEYLGRIGMWGYVREEKQFLDWYYGDSYIHFGSLDDPEKVKSSEWNDIWMEEATEFDYRDFMVLKTRMSAQPTPQAKGRPEPPPNQLFLSFNPENIYHWIKERVVDNKEEDVTEIPSSYKDNPFLTPEYVKQLESLEKQDRNFYRIYTLGEWGQLDSLIFNNWIVIPEHYETEDYIYGSDFGFNVPSALVKIHFDEYENKASVEELIYEAELTNNQFIRLCKERIPEKDWSRVPIYADAAEPDRIQEMENSGLWAVPTHKGAGSVKDGIDFIKRFQVGVLDNSPNINKEWRSYSWRKDKNANTIDEPVKWNDHAMDAIRGALYTHWVDTVGKQPSMKVLDWGFNKKHDDPTWQDWDRFFGGFD